MDNVLGTGEALVMVRSVLTIRAVYGRDMICSGRSRCTGSDTDFGMDVKRGSWKSGNTPEGMVESGDTS